VNAALVLDHSLLTSAFLVGIRLKLGRHQGLTLVHISALPESFFRWNRRWDLTKSANVAQKNGCLGGDDDEARGLLSGRLSRSTKMS
jgi:hypothetical protein